MARLPGRGPRRRVAPGRPTGRGGGDVRGRRDRPDRARPRREHGPRTLGRCGRATRRRRSPAPTGWGTTGSPGRRRRRDVAPGRRTCRWSRRRAVHRRVRCVRRRSAASPARQRNRVVLPEPLGPSTATVSPLLVVRSTSRRNDPSVRTMRASSVMAWAAGRRRGTGRAGQRARRRTRRSARDSTRSPRRGRSRW